MTGRNRRYFCPNRPFKDFLVINSQSTSTKGKYFPHLQHLKLVHLSLQIEKDWK